MTKKILQKNIIKKTTLLCLLSNDRCFNDAGRQGIVAGCFGKGINNRFTTGIIGEDVNAAKLQVLLK